MGSRREGRTSMFSLTQAARVGGHRRRYVPDWAWIRPSTLGAPPGPGPGRCWCCDQPNVREDIMHSGAHPEVTVCREGARFLNLRGTARRSDLTDACRRPHHQAVRGPGWPATCTSGRSSPGCRAGWTSHPHPASPGRSRLAEWGRRSHLPQTFGWSRGAIRWRFWGGRPCLSTLRQDRWPREWSPGPQSDELEPPNAAPQAAQRDRVRRSPTNKESGSR